MSYDPPPTIASNGLIFLTTSSGFGANICYMNRMKLIRPYVMNQITLAGIVASVGNIDLGIYDDDGTAGAPGTLLTSTGSVASPGTGQRTFAVPEVRVSGMYYIALACSSGSFSVNIAQGNMYDPETGVAHSSPYWNKSSAFPLPNPMTSPAATSLGPAAWIGHS